MALRMASLTGQRVADESCAMQLAGNLTGQLAAHGYWAVLLFAHEAELLSAGLIG